MVVMVKTAILVCPPPVSAARRRPVTRRARWMKARPAAMATGGAGCGEKGVRRRTTHLTIRGSGGTLLLTVHGKALVNQKPWIISCPQHEPHIGRF